MIEKSLHSDDWPFHVNLQHLKINALPIWRPVARSS